MSLLLIPFLFLVSLGASASLPVLPDNTTRGGLCRCFPGDSCWPSKAVWDDFNKTVGGHLVRSVPLGSVCYYGPNYDKQACEKLQDDWFLPETHYESSSSIMAPFFANNSCNPFTPQNSSTSSTSTSGCSLGGLVQYAVDAREKSHFQAALRFATQKNIRLVIRNTAHDWLGKSTGAGALAIWTHHYKDVEVLKNYKSSYYTGPALKVGAGAQFTDAYQAAHDAGLVVVGGTCHSVGLAGGYTQGAGHGYLASKLGLGADQALEWEVLTADGTIRIASPERNADLFWALAGGGGGTYGVVLSLTVRAHVDQVTSGANLTFASTAAGGSVSQDVFYEGVREFVAGLPPLLDAGATTTWINTNDVFILAPAVGFGMTKTKLDGLFAPILDKLKALNITYVYYSAEFPTFLGMYNVLHPADSTAMYQIGSRLIPRRTIGDHAGATNFTAALRAITSEHGGTISGLAFNASRPSPLGNAVIPAFREAAVSLVVGTNYDYTNPQSNLANQHVMTDSIVPLLQGTIRGKGYAYLNEGNPWEPDWKSVFYGDNYGRLLKIKQKYDPEYLLYARTAVGSDYWTQKPDGRLCRA